MTFITKKGISRTQRFAVSSRYKQLQDNNLGHSLEKVPFVGAALRRTKEGWCQISARYINQEGLEIVWTVNTPVRLCFKLDWDALASEALRQVPHGRSQIIAPPPSASSIIELRIDMPEEGTYSPEDIPQIRQSKLSAFTMLKELVLVGFEDRLHLLPFFSQNCTALENLHLEGEHNAQDVRDTLKGCPKLRTLSVSTITCGAEDNLESLTHGALEELILVSDIPVTPVLKSIDFLKLGRLDSWAMPGVVPHGPAISADLVLKLLQNSENRNLGLNHHVLPEYMKELDDHHINYTRLV